MLSMNKRRRFTVFFLIMALLLLSAGTYFAVRQRQLQQAQALSAAREQQEQAEAQQEAARKEQEQQAQLEQQRQQDLYAAAARKAQQALDAFDYAGALTAAAALEDADDRAQLEAELAGKWADLQPKLHETYARRLHAGAWYTLVQGERCLLTGDKRYEGLTNELPPKGHIVSGMFSFMVLQEGQVTLVGDTLGATEKVQQIEDAVDGALGLNHGLVLHADGTVTHLGAGQYGRTQAEEWTDLAAVAAGGFHSLGLKKDGTVAAAGLNLDGQCDVDGWQNVTAIAAGLRHSVALLLDGTVVAVGDNSFGQCEVDTWQNIIAIRCGGNFTLGLTAEGRLLAVGDNGAGQCNVEAWPSVVAMDGGLWHTVALLSDGQIVTAGGNGTHQRELEGEYLFSSGAAVQPAEALPEGELVYTGDEEEGPWFYCSKEGCVVAAYELMTPKRKVTRADCICTYGHPPIGILSGGGDRPSAAVPAPKLARQNRAVLAVTGDYFTFGYNADGLQLRRGIVHKQEQDEVGFGFFPDGSMRLIDPHATTAEDLLSQGVQDAWVFGPALIDGGQALDIHKHPLSHNDVTMRTVMGSICPYHHVAAGYGAVTLGDVTEDLLSYGCTVAYNLDGGRSSMMVFMGRQVINPTWFKAKGLRSLQDMVGFLTSDTIQP